MIEVTTLGSGPPVVLLHGPPLPPESMAPLYQRLAESYQVFVPAYRGLGTGPVDTRARLVEALQAHGVRRAAFVTHSYASTHAFALALDGPLEVSRIVALGPVGHLPDEVLAGYEQLAQAIEAEAIDVTQVLLGQWFTPGHLAAHPEVEATFRRWFDDFGKEGLATSARTDFRAPDLRPRLPGLQVPVLLQVGSEDQATPVAMARELESLLPQATLQVVKGAGHFPHLEDADATAKAIGRFLGS